MNKETVLAAILGLITACSQGQVSAPIKLSRSQVAVGNGKVCATIGGRLYCNFRTSFLGDVDGVSYGGTEFCCGRASSFVCFSGEEKQETFIAPSTTERLLVSSGRACYQHSKSVYCLVGGEWKEKLSEVSSFSQNSLVSCASKQGQFCCSSSTSPDSEMRCEKSPFEFVKMDSKKTDTCGIALDGNAYCFGVLYDTFDYDEFKAPVENPVHIAAGTLYGCASSPHNVLCWKDRGDKITAKVMLQNPVDDMGCDHSMCCAVSKDTVYCWGQDDESVYRISLSPSQYNP